MESLNKKQCTLCTKSDPQIISILLSIQQKLSRLLQKSSFHQHHQQQNHHHQGFSRLIRVIFNNKFKHIKANHSCRHDQIKKSLTRKLKCSLNVLNFLCDELAAILGKFNFHIDVLIQQMKSFQRYLKTQKNDNQQQLSLTKENVQDNQNNQKAPEISQNEEWNLQKIQKKTKIQQNQYMINKSIPTFESYSQIEPGFIHHPYYQSMNLMWYFNGQ